MRAQALAESTGVGPSASKLRVDAQMDPGHHGPLRGWEAAEGILYFLPTATAIKRHADRIATGQRDHQ